MKFTSFFKQKQKEQESQASMDQTDPNTSYPPLTEPGASSASTIEDAQFSLLGSDGFLSGTLLVASPLITESVFHKSVIYLFAHSDDGAMGCMINQPIDTVNYGALLGESDPAVQTGQRELDVYFGGPVERTRGFVLHSSEYKPELALHAHDDVSITAVSGILRDMAQGEGPDHASLIVGYAGWAPGQLETEIEQNSWINVPASKELLFDTPNDLKWARASQSLGFDMAFYSHSVGHA